LKGFPTQLIDFSRRKTKSYSKTHNLDIVGTTIEVSDPKFISNPMLMTRKQFEEKIEELKKALAEKFDTKIEFTHDDIDN
jgi:hypothetical protein